MQSQGAIRVHRRPSAPILPLLAATGVVLVAIGAAYLVRGTSSVERPRAGAVPERVAPATEDWGFVLAADVNSVLRHRPGLEPVDFLRTHAFGWDGLTIEEVLATPTLVRELRMHPDLSPVDLIRLEARGS